MTEIGLVNPTFWVLLKHKHSCMVKPIRITNQPLDFILCRIIA